MIGDHHFFSFRISFLGVVFLLFVSGCASVPSGNDSGLPAVPDADAAPEAILPILRAAYPPLINNAAISAAIVSTLQRYGFAVASVSPETGLVETDWRMATEVDEKFSNTVPGVPRDRERDRAVGRWMVGPGTPGYDGPLRPRSPTRSPARR